MMRSQFLLMVAVLLLLPACMGEPEGGAQLANPASQDCIEQGGEVRMEERGDGGQYGVCVFPDGKQCEEWAMWRGDCPPGGVEASTVGDAAQRYCVISGGELVAQGEDDNSTEYCVFADGRKIDLEDYFNGVIP